MLTNACKALAKHWVSRHHPTFGAAYILDSKSNGDSIKFSLSNADKRAVGLIPAQELAH